MRWSTNGRRLVTLGLIITVSNTQYHYQKVISKVITSYRKVTDIKRWSTYRYMTFLYVNESTQTAQTSAKEAYYLIARTPDLESQHGNPDHPKNFINCSQYHCRAILKISSKSAHNLLRNGWISNWTGYGNPDHHKNLTDCSLYHCWTILKTSSKSI